LHPVSNSATASEKSAGPLQDCNRKAGGPGNVPEGFCMTGNGSGACHLRWRRFNCQTIPVCLRT
jgi:hypothetical protein